eukprot:TRINITY_DN14439_c0_g1_i4.p1 TRINITY_DN14439_c0_g1~~TRINITY_DN14439_c0_g1_i4.p1  ORF type:complete len:596 (+),score=95.51 TRINITY_DN14439_c0_g1_i4:34-1821(+)
MSKPKMITITGQLLHEGQIDGEDKPIRNTTVKVMNEGFFFSSVLGQVETDVDGFFSIAAPEKSVKGCDLKVFIYLPEVRYDKKGCNKDELVPLRSYVPRRYSNITPTEKDEFNCGVIRAACWEYRSEASSYTPRHMVHEYFGICQEQRTPRLLMKRAIQLNMILMKAGIVERPLSLTHKMTDMHSDEYFVEMALNGFNPCDFVKEPKTGLYTVDYKWNGVRQDGAHYSPNTKAFFKKDGQTLKIVGIEITARRGGFTAAADAEYGEPVYYTPEDTDPELWMRVKRVWRTNYFIFGEGLTHLAATHLNVEQYLLPIHRNLRKNPVLRLLSPHFYGTVAINFGADNLLTGGTGLVPLGSALTRDSICEVIRGYFKGLTWKDWKPEDPLCPKHDFAHLSKRYWKLVSRYVDDFFSQNDAAIRGNWCEIKNMSDELVRMSLPFDPASDTEGSGRVKVAGYLRTIAPITQSETADDNGYENLKQICRYLLFIATFKHSWVNDMQYVIGGNPEYATLGLDYDITKLDSSYENCTAPLIKDLHVLNTYALTQVKYGYLLADEEHDINPALKKLLFEQKDAFSKYKFAGRPYDVSNIRSCINV